MIGAAGYFAAAGAATVTVTFAAPLAVGITAVTAFDIFVVPEAMDIVKSIVDSPPNPDAVAPVIDVPGSPEQPDTGCFAAGTVVCLLDGSFKNIEQLRVGDYLAAGDTNSLQIEEKVVTQTYIHHRKQTLDVALENGEVIRTTAVHRFSGYVHEFWPTCADQSWPTFR